jgi:RNA polymerase sigma-70 factor (ECF subfamily)
MPYVLLPWDDFRIHPIGIQQSPLPKDHGLARFFNSLWLLCFEKEATMEKQTISTVELKSDNELMEAVGRRESDAIQEIYKRYESTLRSVIQSVLHDEGETDDALNDVFLQLWDQSDRFDAAKGLHGFLITMARRRALDRLRRRLAYRRATDRFETEVKVTYAEEKRAHDFQLPNSDLADLLHAVIGTLPILQQEVVNLAFFEGLSQREISARKSIALGTVKTRLQLAQKKLFNQLAPVLEMI